MSSSRGKRTSMEQWKLKDENGVVGARAGWRACCKIAVVRIGYFSFGGLVVGQFITDQDEQ